MEKCLNDKSIFIDVGANIGYFSIFAEKKYGCKVIAIEPSLREISRFNDNMELNKCENIVTHFCACGSKEKSSFLCLSNFENPSMNYISSSNTADSVIVNVKTIDSLLHSTNLTNITLCKIDVEGYELDVLNGIINSFSAMTNCTYVVEISPLYLKRNNATVDNIYDFFINRNYKPIFGKQKLNQWEEVFKPTRLL
jgi:FkbM family methyltransferase